MISAKVRAGALLLAVAAWGPPVAAETRSDRMLADEADGTNWAGTGRTQSTGHYSPLTDIDETNVGRLGLAWSLDLPPAVSAQAEPLAVDGVLYVASGLSLLRAIDAVSGRQLWEYDPDVALVAGDKLKVAWGIRGLGYWEGKVYVGTQDGRLIAVDATTGKPVWSVQTTEAGDGRNITGPPRLFNGKVVIGHGGADFYPVRGYVTAYDANTGKQLWRFHTVPGDPAKGFENEAMEMAARTWTGEWWKHGGGGTAWHGITYDPQFNRVYIGTGNGSPWNRKIRSPGGGDNLFLCSIVALDAETGAYLWHYQTTPGETWDFNSAMDIDLATLEIAGRQRPVLLHAPKNGFFYVIDRETGKLVSAEKFARVTWASHVDMRTGRPVETPDARYADGETLVFPGPTGAHAWQAMSFNPKTGLAYIPTMDNFGHYNDRDEDPRTWRHLGGGLSSNGTSRRGPPPELLPKPEEVHGFLQAWDPVAQKRVWSVPMPALLNGGVLSTASGLVFHGRADGSFHALSATTGKSLWQFDAQNGIAGSAITYKAGGRQYVTVLAGYGGTGGIYTGSEKLGWNYRTQPRRVLTFVVGGSAALPRTPPAEPLEIAADVGVEIDPAAAARGEAAFHLTCVMCHGAGATAGGSAPDLRSSSIVPSAEAFSSVVHDGALLRQGMPVYDKLTPRQVEDLRHYIAARARAARERPSN